MLMNSPHSQKQHDLATPGSHFSLFSEKDNTELTLRSTDMLQSLSIHIFTVSVAVLVWWTIPSSVSNTCLYVLAFGSGCFLCYTVACCLDSFLPRRSVSTKHKAVFITGCDTGFGHLLAKRLDSKGFKVFAGCLYPSGLDAENLKSSSSKSLRIVGIDVTKDESVQQALNLVKDELGSSELWAVVNNAGIILRGELEWTPLEDQMHQFDINTFGVIRVTQAFLPLLRKYKGRVVTTTSMGGRFTFAGFVPYCMTKHATYSFCNGLRQEMEKWGVKVVTVEPFSHRTSMTDTVEILRSSDSTWSKASASVKQEYGLHYIEKFKKAVIKFNKLILIKETKKVIDCLEEAVSAKSPHYTYNPGDVKSQFGFWWLLHAPITPVNAILRTFVTFDKYMERYLKARSHCNDNNQKKC